MSSVAPRLGETVDQLHAPNRSVHTVFLHCSASSDQAVDATTIDRWHRERGWSGIGYHFFITSGGVVQYGRDLEITPAAQGGHNSGTIAICNNGLVPNDFSSTALAATFNLCLEIADLYPQPVRFRGHREVAAKSCPVYDYRSLLGLDESGYFTHQPSQEIFALSNIERWAVRQGDHGKIVKLAQGLLTAQSSVPPGKIDGDAGPKFTRSVESFQHQRALVVDGVIGQSTWEMLEQI